MLVPFAHSDKRTDGGKPAGLDHADSFSGVRILKTRSQMLPPKIAPHRRSYGIVERPLTAAFREGGQDPISVIQPSLFASQHRTLVQAEPCGWERPWSAALSEDNPAIRRSKSVAISASVTSLKRRSSTASACRSASSSDPLTACSTRQSGAGLAGPSAKIRFSPSAR